LRPDLPIIMCTGHSEKVDKADAYNIGIKAYMEKPLKNRELLQMVAQLLDDKAEQNIE